MGQVLPCAISFNSQLLLLARLVDLEATSFTAETTDSEPKDRSSSFCARVHRHLCSCHHWAEEATKPFGRSPFPRLLQAWLTLFGNQHFQPRGDRGPQLEKHQWAHQDEDSDWSLTLVLPTRSCVTVGKLLPLSDSGDTMMVPPSQNAVKVKCLVERWHGSSLFPSVVCLDPPPPGIHVPVSAPSLNTAGPSVRSLK